MVQLLEKPATDQGIIQTDRTWEQFKHVQQGFENSPNVRLAFYEETIEILVPGQPHETFSSIIGCLLMIFLAERKVSFVPTGSMTQEKACVASAQADESYCIGGLKPIPDLSIEVVLTSGGLPKLKRYQALGVSEVWFWQDGSLEFYHLREGGYEKIGQSELDGLRALDIELLTQCILMAETDAGEAIRQFQMAI